MAQPAEAQKTKSLHLQQSPLNIHTHCYSAGCAAFWGKRKGGTYGERISDTKGSREDPWAKGKFYPPADDGSVGETWDLYK